MQTALPVKRRTREATAERRARILDAAIGLFGERGYYGFTIQELGKRCGLSNPGLLHYFPSKLDVLLAVLNDLEARETEYMEPLVRQAVEAEGKPNSKLAVLAVLRALVERATAEPAMVRVMLELQVESQAPDHPAHAWWQRREDQLLGLFARLVAPHVAEPQALARMLQAQFDGLCAQWLRAYPSLSAIHQWNAALARLVPELHDDPA